jgi:hypothetical protein
VTLEDRVEALETVLQVLIERVAALEKPPEGEVLDVLELDHQAFAGRIKGER